MQGRMLSGAAVVTAACEPGASLALRFGDFAGRHLKRDLGAAFLATGRARKGSEVEPFVRFDQVDGHAASAGRISDPEIEQGVDIALFGVVEAAPDQELRALLADCP